MKHSLKNLWGLLGLVAFSFIFGAGLQSCSEEKIYPYETGYDDGVYRGGVYVDGQLYIPMVLDEENGYATGDVGDFYILYWNLDSDSSISPNVVSSMTEEEWNDFVTKGIYGRYRYDLAFSSTDDFWDNYYGAEENGGSGLTGAWYFYQADSDNPILGRESAGGWLKDTEWYYNCDGFNWRIQPDGSPFDGPYFGFGVDSNIFAQNVYPYDENGSKFVFILTIPSKNPDVNPDINFYAYVHVLRDVDSFYIPLALDSNPGIPVTEVDGEFYVNTSDLDSITYNDPAIVSSMTYDEWVKFVTTGEYAGQSYDLSNYGVNYKSDLDFWNYYWGKDTPVNDNTVAEGYLAAWYYYSVNSKGKVSVTQGASVSKMYLREIESYYNFNGYDWRIQPVGCPYDGPYFAFGLDTKLKGSDDFPFDDDGAKMVFVLTFPSRNEYDSPNINFYAIIHSK